MDYTINAPNMNTYWTFEQSDGTWFDGEFATKAQAEKFADNLFAEKCEDSGLHTYEAQSKIVHFSYDDESEMVIHEILPLVLAYEREPEYERTYG